MAPCAFHLPPGTRLTLCTYIQYRSSRYDRPDDGPVPRVKGIAWWMSIKSLNGGLRHMLRRWRTAQVAHLCVPCALRRRFHHGPFRVRD